MATNNSKNRNLYAGSLTEFIDLSLNRQISDLLTSEFKNQLLEEPAIEEVRSWRNSLFELAKVLEKANLKDVGVILEYKLPLNKRRLDVLLCGRDKDNQRHAVIIELKQWATCRLTAYNSKYVITYIGGKDSEVLHPSVQVGNYKYYFQGNSSIFYEGEEPVKLSACSYLHNYHFSTNDVLTDPRFERALQKFPLYTADDADALSLFICDKIQCGGGIDMLTEIIESEARPSEKLLKHTADHIRKKLSKELRILPDARSEGDFILLDEQLIVYDMVMNLVTKGLSTDQKYAVIVKGGAGTGKSVIGLQLLANVIGSKLTAQFATGSKAFTKTLRKILGANFSHLIQYFISYEKTAESSIDLLILDEAHRIRENKNGPISPNLQIRQLIKAARTTVFFTDDYQIVRGGEIGTAAFIKEQAELAGCKVLEYKLNAQFRNGGSERYSSWIKDLLKIETTDVQYWVDEPHFKFTIMDSPEALKKAIMDKYNLGFSARLVAGFCWDWTKALDKDGKLKNNVTIGDFQMPWNADDVEAKNSPDFPESSYWAYDQRGIDQIGCIYTCQGFEFDYAGVIFGPDLRYNPATLLWEGFPNENFDGVVKKHKNFFQLVKNTYGVLLTRASKECFVYFMDKETELYFRSRIKNV